MPILSDFDLSGRVAIFHTAGGDEGPGLASALAEAGASVFAVGRREGLVEPILAGLEGRAGHGSAVSGLRSRSDAEGVVAECGARLGKVDILVNDARSFFAKPAADISEDEWDEVHSRNLRAVFLLCQAAGRHMADREFGRIVNVISGTAERGVINASAFAATQAGLLSLTRSLAVEWGRANIRINALGTGWTIARMCHRRCSRRSCWCGTRRCGGRGIPGMSGRCWSISAPRPAITRRGNQCTWTGG